MKDWFVYILECADGTFYTGITDNVERRLEAHNSRKGAKYTKGRTPVNIRLVETVRGRSKALKREVAIKKLNKNEKLKLISAFVTSGGRILT